MRVAIVTQTRARIGGVETYLESVIPGLAGRHTLAFWSASPESGDRGAIDLPPEVTTFAPHSSDADAVARLKAFGPDVVLANGLDDARLEAQLLAVAPAVAIQHNYNGACISGSKTMAWPVVRVCNRPLGPACLALYFPRRCGGLNPLTMSRLYNTQIARRATLARCAAVVTLSEHMRDEMLRQGLSPARLHVIPPFVAVPDAEATVPKAAGPTTRLLFLGRLEPLKGVARLLDALPLIAAAIARPVSLTIAGDGADRGLLEDHARRIQSAEPRVTVRFAGWQQAEGRDRLLAETDAIVVPSLWPEPFGLVGLEAGAAGVPAVAFAAGGIVDWLKDDATGTLAAADGARPQALAEAIVRCVGNPDVRARLGRAARAFAAAWTIERHLAALDAVLWQAAAAAASPTS
jgi:glycosyltransferase involved in cell wall biosynthesis